MSTQAARRQGGLEIRGQINVTPLVDVCLVLLIIFMVVTPLLRQVASVDLPATRRPSPMPETSRQLTISLLSDGTSKLGQNLVAEPDLPAALRRAHLQDGNRKVVVKADRHLKYRTVLSLMRDLSRAGFDHAGLATGRLPSAKRAIQQVGDAEGRRPAAQIRQIEAPGLRPHDT